LKIDTQVMKLICCVMGVDRCVMELDVSVPPLCKSVKKYAHWYTPLKSMHKGMCSAHLAGRQWTQKYINP
jgi:hypothetical protein